MVLSELESVDYIIVFDTDTPMDLLEAIRPNVLVKGGDYSRNQVVGGELLVTTSQLGPNLYIGNHPGPTAATGRHSRCPSRSPLRPSSTKREWPGDGARCCRSAEEAKRWSWRRGWTSNPRPSIQTS